MKNNVFVIETGSGLEVIKAIDDNFFIGASKKTKVHRGMINNKKITYCFTRSENSLCPFCNKENFTANSFDLAIIYIKDRMSLDIGVFNKKNELCGLLGDDFDTSGVDYEIILKIRSFMPSSEAYILERINDLGLTGTKYEKVIKEYFLNFSTRESMSLSLSAHRTTISRAIKKITNICRVCGY